MTNYKLELDKLLNKIYYKNIYDILLKESTDNLNKLTPSKAKQIITSTDVFLGNDLKDFIIGLIPQGADDYFLKVAISKAHNINYPILYNKNKESVKSLSYNKFATTLWHEHTIDLLLNDLFNLFKQDNFNKFVNENLDDIFNELISYILTIKSNSTIVININDNGGLVNTFKKMLLNGQLDYSYALSVVDMNMIREEMTSTAVSLDYYDEFDKLEDELEKCLDKYFKYNDSELLDMLIEKEGFKLIDNNRLIK